MGRLIVTLLALCGAVGVNGCVEDPDNGNSGGLVELVEASDDGKADGSSVIWECDAECLCPETSMTALDHTYFTCVADAERAWGVRHRACELECEGGYALPDGGSASSCGRRPEYDSLCGGESREWRTANLTWYTSYPDPGSEECLEYNGCTWAGWFAGLEERQPESWVASHNIAAVHSRDFDTYRGKTLRLRKNGREIDVVVYDMCADSDCNGCCTANSRETGFLIDIESYTADRFGERSGIVEWTCLDCD